MNIFEITNIFDWLSGSGSGSATYAPAMWLNHMGLSNKTAVNTRTSTGTVFDHEGLVVTTEPGEISIEGARRVENLHPSATDFATSDWAITHTASKLGVAAGIVPGGGDAMEISFGSSTSARLAENSGSQVVGAGDYVTRYRIRAVSGTTSVRLYCASATSGAIPLGENWVWVSSSKTLSGSAASKNFGIRNNSAGDSANIYIAAAQFQEKSGSLTKTIPDEFVDSTDHGYGVPGVKYFDTTNGNTVTDNIVTEAPGYKFLVDGGRKEQNDLYSQQDISTWAATAGVTTVQNADGSWRVTLPAGGTISTSSDLATPSVTYDAGRELVTAVTLKQV